MEPSPGTVTVPALAAVPGLVHGFGQRHARGTTESREATRMRVRAALAGHGRLYLMAQVHGARVLPTPWDGAPEGDAALAEAPGILVGVVTADCLPVLLVDPGRGVVAAAHAGWRGTAAGVVSRAVEALVANGSRPGDLVAAAGPGIASCCYEVGEDVREAFGPGGEAFFRPGPRGRPHLDVRAANVGQLLEAGVPEDHVHHVADCTSCRGDLYYSHRREGPGTGRMISFVGYRG